MERDSDSRAVNDTSAVFVKREMETQASASGGPPKPPKTVASESCDGDEGSEEIERLLKGLLSFGWLTPEELARARERGSRSGSTALEVLLAAGTITPSHIELVRTIDASTEFTLLASR